MPWLRARWWVMMAPSTSEATTAGQSFPTGGAAQLVWVKSLPQPIGSAPAIDAAGNIYVGTSHRDDISDGLSGMPTQYPDGTVWAFDSEGNHLWHHTFSGGKLNKSFAIGEDGSLYVATQGRPYGVYRFRPQ